MVDRILLYVVRRSWRCYQALSFVVESSGFRIPITNGMGLGMFDAASGIATLLRTIYARRRGVFVDIGANTGRVLLELLKIDRSIPYVGFEPLIPAACYVQRLIKENRLQKTHAIYSIALADYCGPSVIMLCDDSDVSATITSSVRPTSMYTNRATTCVSTGDIQLKQVEAIAAIKIDVEGAEPLVLNGLRETIYKHRPAIIIEVMPYSYLEDDSYDRSYFGELPQAERIRLVANRKRHMETIGAIMDSLGYKFFRVGEGGLRNAKPSDTTFADQDFLLLPEEDAASTEFVSVS